MNTPIATLRSLAIWTLTGLLLVGGTEASAQLSTMATPASASASLPTGGISSGGSSGGSSSGGGGSTSSSHPRWRTAVSFFWHDPQPTIYTNRTYQPISIPPARRDSGATLVTPVITGPNERSGLSTAMPGWKLASSISQSSMAPTGHTTYIPPSVLNNTTVVLPRRRYAYGITVFRH